MQFDFISMQALYLSLARSDPAPLIRALTSRPVIAPESQWANFVRNHDELTLDKLTECRAQEVFEAFAPDERQRIYGRGITRRIPPMLGGDPRRIRMVYSLLFSLPGTPVLFYGEEIGMGENTDIEGRRPCARRCSGAPRRQRRILVGAAVAPPGAAPRRRLRAAARQRPDQRNDDGLAAAVRPAPRVRYRSRRRSAGGSSRCSTQDPPAVLAHSPAADVGRMIALHNFSDVPAVARLSSPMTPTGCAARPAQAERWRWTSGRGRDRAPAYGYRWLRVARPGDNRLG